MEADIGLIGLAVMGQNLVLNLEEHGFTVSVFNRTFEKTEEFLAKGAKGKAIYGYKNLQQFIGSLKKPRKILFMVKAGAPVDALIEEVLPFLEPGDVIIDGGNSLYVDSQRRMAYLEQKSLLFMGMGISGGEEGARHGPSLMPGGSKAAWSLVKPIFEAIAAKSKEDGKPCCSWIGTGGAGHYVKMVHNGIEYGDIQLIAEAYHLLKNVVSPATEEWSSIFSAWNKTELSSYLIEITSRVLTHKEGKGLLVDKILDQAAQKGTGKWTGINALELGVPVSLIIEAVLARCLSSLKQERVAAGALLKKSIQNFTGDKKLFIEELRQALYLAKIMSYTQGFMLMRAASQEMRWQLNYGEIALIWREGCIIRSVFLDKIKKAYENDGELQSLFFDPFFLEEIRKTEPALRKVVAIGIERGVPLPSFCAALSFLDGYTTESLPSNLIQALRDCFGAHMYERVDRKGFFHTDWLGTGGDVSSTPYSV